jgi:hypothetical protein
MAPMLKRGERFRHAIGSTLHYPTQFGRGGSPYTGPALRIETARVLRALTKIVRGLSWHEGRYCDFPDASVRILSQGELQALPLPEAQRLSARYGAGMPRVILEGVFEYHFTTAAGKLDDSAWWLIFYGSTRFLATIGDTA